MPSKHRPRVLCVDNHEDSREMLSTVLRFSRIETRTAATAAHALWLSQSERFDLNLLDAWLPDLDGFELCRRLRALGKKLRKASPTGRWNVISWGQNSQRVATETMTESGTACSPTSPH